MEPASNEAASENVIVKAEPTLQYFPSRYDRPEFTLGTFELMKLPTELRLRIFYFLAPSTNTIDFLLERRKRRNWGTYWGEQDRFLSCNGAILRTNRKIYGEVIDLWYSTACYRVELYGSLRFLNREFQKPSELPYGFQFLAHLTLEVMLWSSFYDVEGMMLDKRKVRRMEKSQHQRMLRHLVELFKPSGSGKLQNLTIQIRPGFRFFTPMDVKYPPGIVHTRPERQKIVYAILEYNLRKLREMRVSGTVSVGESKKSHVAFDYCGLETIKDVRIVMEKYFRQLEREISGSGDGVERKEELR